MDACNGHVGERVLVAGKRLPRMYFGNNYE
jgi:hypothetical protein